MFEKITKDQLEFCLSAAYPDYLDYVKFNCGLDNMSKFRKLGFFGEVYSIPEFREELKDLSNDFIAETNLNIFGQSHQELCAEYIYRQLRDEITECIDKLIFTDEYNMFVAQCNDDMALDIAQDNKDRM